MLLGCFAAATKMKEWINQSVEKLLSLETAEKSGVLRKRLADP